MASRALTISHAQSSSSPSTVSGADISPPPCSSTWMDSPTPTLGSLQVRRHANRRQCGRAQKVSCATARSLPLTGSGACGSLLRSGPTQTISLLLPGQQAARHQRGNCVTRTTWQLDTDCRLAAHPMPCFGPPPYRLLGRLRACGQLAADRAQVSEPRGAARRRGAVRSQRLARCRRALCHGRSPGRLWVAGQSSGVPTVSCAPADSLPPAGSGAGSLPSTGSQCRGAVRRRRSACLAGSGAGSPHWRRRGRRLSPRPSPPEGRPREQRRGGARQEPAAAAEEDPV